MLGRVNLPMSAPSRLSSYNRLQEIFVQVISPEVAVAAAVAVERGIINTSEKGFESNFMLAAECYSRVKEKNGLANRRIPIAFG
jgi:hypothetical protein